MLHFKCPDFFYVFFPHRLGETLEFNPVRKGDSGTYFCMAKNEVGSSDELSVTFDVLYRPKKVNISPKRLIDLDVGSSAEFKCDSEANPPAQFQWIQKLSEENILLKPKRGSSSSGNKNNGRMISRGLGKTLLLQNVTYENEGKWICVATNSIKGNFVIGQILFHFVTNIKRFFKTNHNYILLRLKLRI